MVELLLATAIVALWAAWLTGDAAQVDAAQVDAAQVDAAQVDAAQVDAAQLESVEAAARRLRRNAATRRLPQVLRSRSMLRNFTDRLN